MSKHYGLRQRLPGGRVLPGHLQAAGFLSSATEQWMLVFIGVQLYSKAIFYVEVCPGLSFEGDVLFLELMQTVCTIFTFSYVTHPGTCYTSSYFVNGYIPTVINGPPANNGRTRSIPCMNVVHFYDFALAGELYCSPFPSPY